MDNSRQYITFSIGEKEEFCLGNEECRSPDSNSERARTDRARRVEVMLVEVLVADPLTVFHLFFSCIWPSWFNDCAFAVPCLLCEPQTTAKLAELSLTTQHPTLMPRTNEILPR